MGCDIHLHVERRAPGGSWLEVLPVARSWYDDRNYDVFAMLANVRNGIAPAFGGQATGREITPIDKPRGLPDDLSPAVKEVADEWDSDGHSHSYFAAADLLAVDWSGSQVEYAGLVGPDEFYRHDRFKQSPQAWCGGSTQKCVTNDEMRSLISSGVVKTKWTGGDGAGESIITRLEWSESWIRAAGLGWAALLLDLYRLGSDDLSAVRTVFWFDN